MTEKTDWTCPHCKQTFDWCLCDESRATRVFLDDALREQLAKYAHEAWSGWMKYMLEKACFHLPNPHVERWERQMRTAYVDLSEAEKESGRAEADRMLAIVKEAT